MSTPKKRRRITRREGKNDDGHQVPVIANAIRDIHRISIKAAKVASRFRAYVLPDPETVKHVDQIILFAKSVEQHLLAIPSDYKPARGTAGKPVGEGDTVKLTSEAAKRFQGIVPPGMTFVVSKIVGSKLVCVSQGQLGEAFRLPLTRSSVQRVGDIP